MVGYLSRCYAWAAAQERKRARSEIPAIRENISQDRGSACGLEPRIAANSRPLYREPIQSNKFDRGQPQ
ncbi:MAG: hypothetical protein RLZZ115_888 [Cyanobacteriota bacterium]